MEIDSTPQSQKLAKLRSVSGFLALPLNLASSSLIKYILFRAYKTRKVGSQTATSNDVDYRTLYVTNLAPHCCEKDLINIFGVCGTIESVRLETRDRATVTGEVDVAAALSRMIEMKKEEQNLVESAAQHEFLSSRLKRLERNILGEAEIGAASFESSGYALVTFEEESAVSYAMESLTSMTSFGKSEKGVGKRSHGLKRWLKDWSAENEADPKELQKQADIALHQYDKRLREQKRLQERLSTNEDSNGWTLIAPRGKKKSTAGAQSVGSASLSQTQLRMVKAEKDKQNSFDDFYKFQRTDMKSNRIDSLKRRFAKDKADMRKMQGRSRKFSPM